ncbi:MAG: GNAT family N-acetyltransferase [Nitrospinaceae bacterium]
MTGRSSACGCPGPAVRIHRCEATMTLSIQPELVDLFAPYPYLDLFHGDLETYQQLRFHEPGLVSYLDDKPETDEQCFKVLVLHHKGEPVGCVSIVILTNELREGPSKEYTRIDLVIVRNEWQDCGAGRLMILCALVFLFRNFRDRLYSISSLAAHGAVKKVLEDCFFKGRPQEERGFTHEELKLEEINLDEVFRELADKTEKQVKIVDFRFRQR